MKSNLSQRLLMSQRIIRTIYNCKYHSHPEMMPSIWGPCIWDLLRVSQLEWSSIPGLNILLSPLPCVMTRLQETSSSRSTTHSLDPSFRETNWMKDAKRKHMTWKNPTPTRFFQKLHPNWPTVQPNCKDLFGKTMPVSNHWRAQLPNLLNSRCNLRTTNAHISNSWLSTNHKVLVRTQMESSDFPLTKTWARKSFTTCGQWRTTESSTTQWLVSVSPPRKWEKLHMHSSVAITHLKLLEELKGSRHSRTFQIGLEHGLLKAKEWHMDKKPCNNLDRIPATPLSSILVALSCQFHLMFSRKSAKNGHLHFLN